MVVGLGVGTLVGIGVAAVAGGFVGLWLIERRTQDASLVDVGWTLAIGFLAILYAFGSDGWGVRRAVMAALVGLWSLRLAYHIYARHRGKPEDSRYRELREHYGARAHRFFFLFYQAQAVSALLLSVPFLLIARNAAPQVHPIEIVAVALALGGVILETIADRQLEEHKADPSLRGTTCRRGLWAYSRHPNYFFEWVIWCGFGLAALPSPYGFFGLLSPAIMFYLIVRVTGIPPSEERALANRGDDYRAYQKSVSAFFPWFPKPNGVA